MIFAWRSQRRVGPRKILHRSAPAAALGGCACSSKVNRDRTGTGFSQGLILAPLRLRPRVKTGESSVTTRVSHHQALQQPETIGPHSDVLFQAWGTKLIKPRYPCNQTRANQQKLIEPRNDPSDGRATTGLCAPGFRSMGSGKLSNPKDSWTVRRTLTGARRPTTKRGEPEVSARGH